MTPKLNIPFWNGKRDYIIEKQPLFKNFSIDCKSIRFIMIGWIPWIKKRVNCLSYIEGKAGWKTFGVFLTYLVMTILVEKMSNVTIIFVKGLISIYISNLEEWRNCVHVLHFYTEDIIVINTATFYMSFTWSFDKYLYDICKNINFWIAKKSFKLIKLIVWWVERKRKGYEQ